VYLLRLFSTSGIVTRVTENIVIHGVVSKNIIFEKVHAIFAVSSGI
jgi:hypothetical protein